MVSVDSQNPLEWPAQLLLGLEAINSSKNEVQTEAERAQSFLQGTKLIEKAFNANQRSAAAANALCEIFLRKGNHKRVRTVKKLIFSPVLKCVAGTQTCRTYHPICRHPHCPNRRLS